MTEKQNKPIRLFLRAKITSLLRLARDKRRRSAASQQSLYFQAITGLEKLAGAPDFGPESTKFLVL